MGLLTYEVEVKLFARNINHYESLGYNIIKSIDSRGALRVRKGTTIKVKIEDVPKNSHIEVDNIEQILDKELKLNQKLLA